MWQLTKTELVKIFLKPRSYIGFAISLIITFLVTLGLFLEGSTVVELALQSLSLSFAFEGQIINGNLSTYLLYNSFVIHIPILVALVSGDIISGESNSGTIRLLLTKPISRSKLYWSKVISVLIYTLVLVLFFVSSAYLIGMLFLGNGDLVVIRDGINIIESKDILHRFIYAALFSSVSMFTISSLAVCLSAFTKNSLGPIISTIGILIALNIVCTVGFNILKPILPYLFNVHFVKWQNFFNPVVDSAGQWVSVLTQMAYVVVFSVIGFVKFKSKDVLD